MIVKETCVSALVWCHLGVGVKTSWTSRAGCWVGARVTYDTSLSPFFLMCHSKYGITVCPRQSALQNAEQGTRAPPWPWAVALASTSRLVVWCRLPSVLFSYFDAL